MRCTLRHENTTDRRSTLQARITGSLVDIVLDLKATLTPVYVHIIGNGRSAGRDSRGKHLPDRTM